MCLGLCVCVCTGPSGRETLRRVSAAINLLVLWVRIPPGAWISVSYEFCLLPCNGLCDCTITHP